MCCKILDEAGSAGLQRHQQAFVTGGQIEKNVVGIAEAFAQSARDRLRLCYVLFLDCSKGFSLLSWK